MDRLAVGDELFVITTRDCWGQPNRDRTRIIGRATVVSPVEPLEAPVRTGSRESDRGCEIRIESLAPYPRASI